MRDRFRDALWLLCCVVVVCLCSVLVSGATAQGRKAGTIEVKDGTGTNVIVMLRDPFWPVGFDPNAKPAEKIKDPVKDDEKPKQALVVVDTPIDWDGAERKLVVGTIARDRNGEFFALVNGRVKAPGDRISQNHGKLTYNWAILRMDNVSGIKLKRETTRSSALKPNMEKMLE